MNIVVVGDIVGDWRRVVRTVLTVLLFLGLLLQLLHANIPCLVPGLPSGGETRLSL